MVVIIVLYLDYNSTRYSTVPGTSMHDRYAHMYVLVLPGTIYWSISYIVALVLVAPPGSKTWYRY
jgi:hypothetical protein